MRTAQKRQVCVLLPKKQHLDCTVGVRARGHEVLNIVLEHLGVSELQVLSLAVLRGQSASVWELKNKCFEFIYEEVLKARESADNEYLFVSLEHKLSRYFGKKWNRGSLKTPFVLFLRVQYYVQSGQLILSSKVQELYYTELRQKVLQSQSRQQEALFFQLAASALQAEVGDVELGEAGEEADVQGEKRQERKQRHYFLPEDYFPSWLIRRHGREFLLQHCPALHVELRGVSRSQAILQFIKEASSLQDGPVTFYRMRQEKKELRSSILLGVALKGVLFYQEVEGKQCILYDFSWTDIDRIVFQGSRFEINAVGSLCLPKLVYYTPSTFHSKHVLRHLIDSHRLHISTRGAVSYIQQLEDREAIQSYKEAYICDIAILKQRLQGLTSSMSDCSIVMETTRVWSNEDEEEEEDNMSVTEFELCVDEPEELLVDNPAEVPWLANLLHGVSVSGHLMLPSSHWAAVTTEMKQVLRTRADEGVSVD